MIRKVQQQEVVVDTRNKKEAEKKHPKNAKKTGPLDKVKRANLDD